MTKAQIVATAKKILSGLDCRLNKSQSIPASVSSLSITFVRDGEIRNLNRTYRGKDKATDVLSFPLLEGDTGNAPITSLGDVVISIDTTKRQAKEFKVSVREELLRLLTHGILHLCGFDHERVSRKKREAMWKMQDTLLSEIL